MIYVVLPAYNEEKSLPLLLNNFIEVSKEQAFSINVIVVDDGSTDNTAFVSDIYTSKMELTVLKHGVNKGLGAAMRTGFSYVIDNAVDSDVVLTMDADNTHNPNLLSGMLKEIDRGADLVIASRYKEGGKEIGLALYRKFLSYGANMLLRLSFGINGAKDYTCGYRMYRVSTLKRAIDHYGEYFITEDSFVCMAEILVKIGYTRVKIAEVPLVLRYDLKESASKMRKARTIINYVRFILRQKLKSNKHG